MIKRALNQTIRAYKDDRLFFIATISFWLILSLFSFLKAGVFRSANGETVHWSHIFSYTFSSGVLWIPFTILIWVIAKTLAIQKYKLQLLIGLHILLAFTLSFAQRILSMSIDYLIQTQVIRLDGFPSYVEYLNGHFARRWVEGVMWYLLITIVVYGYLQIRMQYKEKTDKSKKNYLSIKKKGTLFMIPFEDILFIKSELNYCYVHTHQDVYKMRISLKMLEQDLRDSTIKRVHNSYMINTAKVFGFDHVQNGEYIFSLQGYNKRISSTKTYRQTAKEIISSIQFNI